MRCSRKAQPCGRRVLSPYTRSAFANSTAIVVIVVIVTMFQTPVSRLPRLQLPL